MTKSQGYMVIMLLWVMVGITFESDYWWIDMLIGLNTIFNGIMGVLSEE